MANRKLFISMVVLLLGCDGASSVSVDAMPLKEGGSDIAESDSSNLKQCPPLGLGVEEHEGISIAEQMNDFKMYDCKEPQILPDLGGQTIDFLLGPTAAPADASFLLTNGSIGTAALEIAKVEVYGDERCFFTDADIVSKVIAPGELAAVKITYEPTKEGDDHAELRIHSNAQNYPVLRLRVCGRAHEENRTGTPLVCKAANSRNALCH